jgi:hypothetical protein
MSVALRHHGEARDLGSGTSDKEAEESSSGQRLCRKDACVSNINMMPAPGSRLAACMFHRDGAVVTDVA